jgi:hypothetical protein
MPEEVTEAAKEEESQDKLDRDLGPETVFPIAKEIPQKFVPKARFPERLTAPKKGSKFDDILEVFKMCRSTFLSSMPFSKCLRMPNF